MTQRFIEAMRLMRCSDPQQREDGFFLLWPHAGEHVGELIAEFRDEDDEDHGFRCRLLELIVEARSLSALPLLTELAEGEDEAFRYWALRGLRRLPGQEARQVLWRARPEEG
ncbi:hypothetical protein C1I98_25360 [Spongiactinospora gelatinilytica]|uniref:HEAT repeat domain-containing protein n=1 Tax=Spongiactinospora gelatinilytica TaxID=2666298 RepID=A0A2W2G4V7_9ACTN|nr:HEAT repeat domain-containing protein [Spongiactinospora gelatinilytica]PZG37459.1 hypothetical protein C1I98_25360 [Spongiactinospora gelatinilytica]